MHFIHLYDILKWKYIQLSNMCYNLYWSLRSKQFILSLFCYFLIFWGLEKHNIILTFESIFRFIYLFFYFYLLGFFVYSCWMFIPEKSDFPIQHKNPIVLGQDVLIGPDWLVCQHIYSMKNVWSGTSKWSSMDFNYAIVRSLQWHLRNLLKAKNELILCDTSKHKWFDWSQLCDLKMYNMSPAWPLVSWSSNTDVAWWDKRWELYLNFNGRYL